jgi:hypothetical protein
VFYSRDRAAEHPERHLANFAGLMQADAFAGFTKLYAPDRKGGPITEAACWAHARRKFSSTLDGWPKPRSRPKRSSAVHGRICLSNNAAERELRTVAVGR